MRWRSLNLSYADEGQSSFPKMVGSLVDAAEQETDGKDTVSFRLLAATAFLVAAASWQPRGRFSKAKALLATAMSHLHLAAKDLAVDLEVSTLLFLSPLNYNLLNSQLFAQTCSVSSFSASCPEANHTA